MNLSFGQIRTSQNPRENTDSHLSLVVASMDKLLDDNYSAWRNLTSSKLKKSEAKLQRKTQKQGQLLNEFGLVLCIT